MGFFSILFPSPIQSEDWEFAPVRYYNPETREFSEPVRILGKGKHILRIQPFTQISNSNVWFALPGFCDAFVTLGVDPWGGSASPDSLKIHLQGFLSSGFTHVESVGDADWVERVRDLVARGLWKGPVIVRPLATILPDPGYPVPKGTYELVRSDQELEELVERQGKGRIHFFQRRLGTYLPTIQTLYTIQKKNPLGKDWVFHTFADPISSQEGLGAEWKVLFHPILGEFPRYQLEKVSWAPLLALYYYQSKRREESWKEERERALESHSFFQVYYKDISTNPGSLLSTQEGEFAEELFQKVQREFSNRDFMKKKLLFATGTGHPLVYPGLAARKELEFWEEAFQNWEEKENLSPSPILEENRSQTSWWFWKPKKTIYQIQHPKPEPTKIPLYRKEILESLTLRTCQFLGAGHAGKIQEGLEAHILFYEKNPLEKSLDYTKPVSVYSHGILQYGKKIHNQKKRK